MSPRKKERRREKRRREPKSLDKKKKSCKSKGGGGTKVREKNVEEGRPGEEDSGKKTQIWREKAVERSVRGKKRGALLGHNI